ncbi:MAG: hypothetical protein RLZZ252_1792, partial [Bacteroidota bacterium]
MKLVPYQISSFQEYQEEYRKSVENPESFWADIASHFHWNKPWDKVLEWNFQTAKTQWFQGAELNITENCIDRHLKTQPHTTAILWEANNPEEASISYTYQQLHEKVNQLSHV